MAQKPSLPKGTRDFGPDVMARRQYILNIIRGTFEKFGFLPLETPAMENLSVLTGKYGDEGDQLMFKILNSGDFLKDVSETDLSGGFKGVTKKVSEKALRYDLTVPFARYVVMNRHAITLPFRRYQIQPVWRADRPQKGRYREFYQCDADVVGTDSLLCEAEIVLMIDEVLSKLGLTDISIKINNRKILTGITEAVGEPGKEAIICTAIDKLDKVSWDVVQNELREKGISDNALANLPGFLNLSGTNEEKLGQLEKQLTNSETGKAGIAEVRGLMQFLAGFGYQKQNVELDFSLARGLSYYTGAIFEVKANNVQMGSISGGGRYDNLTGTFGVPGLSGVGFSFGIDRMYDVLEELNLFPESAVQGTQVLFTNFDKEAEQFALPLLAQLRNQGIRAELYPDQAKLKKQLDYADKKAIPFVVLIGSEEMASGNVQVKNMKTGEQREVKIQDLNLLKVIVNDPSIPNLFAKLSSFESPENN